MAEYFKRVEPREAGLAKWIYYEDQISGNYQGPYQYQGGQYKEGYQGPSQGQYKEQDANRDVARAVKSYYAYDDLRRLRS